MNILITLKETPKGYFALKGDSTNTAIVNAIANDSTQIGYANARAMMRLVFNKKYVAPIFPITHNSEVVKPNEKIILATSSTSPTPNGQFKLYPNPAKNSITIDYVLGNNIQEADIILYDVVGNDITKWTLPIGESSINENVSPITSGVYFYAIFEDNKAVLRNKLVIER